MENLFGRIEPAAVRLHIEDQNIGLRFNRLLHATPHQISERRRDILADRNDIDLLLGSGCLNEKKKSEKTAQRMESRLQAAKRAKAEWPLKARGRLKRVG